ncbi:MAG TPA: trypsin-like peptidase domain-containing protein [Actinomycetes bacterium]|nr:trypsin-like peptidase domain-containing protein [Actinomycetes bacterium]
MTEQNVTEHSANPPYPSEHPTLQYPRYDDPWLPPAPPEQPAPPAPPAPAERPRRGVALLAAVAVTAGLVGGGAGAVVTSALDDGGSNTGAPAATSGVDSLKTASTSGDSAAAEGSVEQVATSVLPSVVSIVETTAGGGGEGTGVIIDSDGLILTNNHVVAAAAEGGSLQVTFNDGRTASATIVGRDPVTDLAVIKAADVSGLTAATLGSSADLDPGEQVVAIGSPLGLQGTVTSGIISALDRPVRTGDATSAETASTVIDAIQTDAAINPGNSGGPLVNLRGEVVGINSAIATLGSTGGQSGSIGLGFSIPIDQAKAIASELVDTGSATHAQLGVSVQDAQTGGAAVAVVSDGSAAQQLGLREGDVITKVGDRQVDDADSLIAAIRSHRPGDEVTLTFTRDGSQDTLTATLGSDASSS